MSALQAVACNDGKQVHAKHSQDKHQSRAVLERAGLLDVRAGSCQHEHMVGKHHDRAENGVRILRSVEDSRGEHDGRRFSGRAGHAQNGAREHARHGARQHHADNGLRLAGAQCQRSLAVGVRHGAQAFLGGADDDGERQDGKGQDAGGDADPHAAEGDEEGEAEQAEDDGRHSGKIVDAKAHEAGKAAAAGVFVKVDCRGNAERECQQQGAKGQDCGAGDAGRLYP